MIFISQEEINLSVNWCTTVIAGLIWVQLHLSFYISIKSPISRKIETLCEKGVKKHEKYALEDTHTCVCVCC